MLLWAYGKTIPPSAEAAVLLSTVSDQVLGVVFPSYAAGSLQWGAKAGNDMPGLA